MVSYAIQHIGASFINNIKFSQVEILVYENSSNN